MGRDGAGRAPVVADAPPAKGIPRYVPRWEEPKKRDLEVLEATRLDTQGLIELHRRINAELMRRDFAEFVKGAWHVVNPGEPLVWGWHLQAICDHVEWVYRDLFEARKAARTSAGSRTGGPMNKHKNLLINVPPRSAKSMIVSVLGPVWAWLHDPGLKVRCTSGNLRVSDRDSDYSRDVIESEWFQTTFAPEWALRGDRKAKRRWENSVGGVRISMPMGAKVTGEGTDVIIVDDPHDAKDAFSERKREAVIAKWDSALRNRVNNPKRHLRICIMQRLHEADFSGHWLRRSFPIHLCIPQEFEPDRRCTTPMLDRATGRPWVDPRTEAGELMLPAFFDQVFIDQEKVALGSYGYAGQHQQRPAPEDGGLFKKSWFKDFDLAWLPNGKPDWKSMPRVDQLYVSIDAAFKGEETSDFVSIQVIGRQGRMRYILDNITARMDFVRTLSAVKVILERWGKVAGILIEDKANGSATVSMLQSAGVAGVIPINPEGGKFSRANAVAPFCEAGDVMIPRIAPWRESWLHEVAVFPNGANDDQVDAFTQALNYMRGSVDVARLLASCKW